MAEAGERESDLRVLEPSIDRMLELRTGSPALKTVCDGISAATSLSIPMTGSSSCFSSRN